MFEGLWRAVHDSGVLSGALPEGAAGKDARWSPGVKSSLLKKTFVNGCH